jgi:hypothetical protein
MINRIQRQSHPRQLALEILDSIQNILFPFSDRKSSKTLRFLVANGDFDPDCLRFEAEAVRNHDEKDLPFYYFSERLGALWTRLRIRAPMALSRNGSNGKAEPVM